MVIALFQVVSLQATVCTDARFRDVARRVAVFSHIAGIAR